MYGFGWSEFNKNFSPPNGYQFIYNAFQYKDADTLQGSPTNGQWTTYEGSGYLYEMRGQLSYIQGNLTLLQQMNWIDRQTRAVFVEFSSYNPKINLIMVSTILVEFLSTGSVLTTARFDPLNLFGESNGISLKTIVETIYMVFVVYFMVIQVRDLLRRGFLAYTSDFWSYIECCIMSTAWISLVMIVYRSMIARQVLDFFKSTSGYGYMKLQRVNECNQTLSYTLGLCVAFGTVKFLKMLRFNRHISHLGDTLKLCFGELASFTMIAFVAWISFVQLMYLIYETNVPGYSSLVRAMDSAFVILLGKFDVNEYAQSNPWLGPLIFSLYNVLMLCFALNIFISIVTQAFDRVRRQAKEHPNKTFDLWKHLKKILLEKSKKRNLTSFAKKNDILSKFPSIIDSIIKYLQVNFFN